jgi:hypothetical protein
MLLIIYYIVIMLMFNVATVLIGFAVESLFGSVVSLIVFLSLYFVTLWAAWVISVWLTKPKVAIVATPAAIVAKV